MSDLDGTAIGFAGLGNMGQPMALNLAEAGFRLTVFDPRAERMEPFRDLGTTIAASPADLLSGADIVVTMLPDTPDVESVVTGPDGIASLGRPGLVHLEMSTIIPSASKRFADLLEARGMRFVDAAVGRSALHAARGESLFMVGAHDADLALVRPLLEAMGDTIVHCGPPGSGIAMKIVNNFQGNVQAQVTAEALVLGARLGLTVDRMVEVMSGTLSVNGFLTGYYPVKALAGDVEPGFALRLANKDLSIAVNLAAELGVPVTAGASAQACVEAACAEYGEKDVTALLDAAADGAGILAPRMAKA
ncbi:NAD(P)-dependent oxidoreductase [Kribbella sp. NBC_00709]